MRGMIVNMSQNDHPTKHHEDQCGKDNLTVVAVNTEHVQGLGANGKAAFSPKAHG